MQKFIDLVDDEHRKFHWCRCAQVTEGSLLSPNVRRRRPCPRHCRPFQTFTQSADSSGLKMLGYRIVVDGDYGVETRRGYELPDAHRNRR